MFLTIASQTLAVLAAATAPVHSTEISHGAQAYSASYHAQPSISLREVEPRFANRNATPVCRWQADLTVNRAVAAQGRAVPAFGKAIHRFAPLSGSYAGSCTAARSQIDAQVARYTASKAAEAVAVAQQDRSVLVNELDGVRALTVQG
ncbi:hypothetical protein SAMN05518849_101752 [Sphingobium sp. AP50]|uniref:hypothetical protein n=1 Tax=Sphingobium sp. AP50 TaxID=1884369 RepID=UPI0008D32992|nr:hypothetical protein [Sphingobium sp. AP50]SEI74267.1 hypothetical protein SAMN05518849_101752 [Sphingobium sp. AP50]